MFQKFTLSSLFIAKRSHKMWFHRENNDKPAFLIISIKDWDHSLLRDGTNEFNQVATVGCFFYFGFRVLSTLSCSLVYEIGDLGLPCLADQDGYSQTKHDLIHPSSAVMLLLTCMGLLISGQLSQASPTPSRSRSVCMGLGTLGQLSSTLGMPMTENNKQMTHYHDFGWLLP